MFVAPASAAAPSTSNVEPTSSSQWCNNHFGFANYSGLRSWLTGQFGAPNSNQVWQASSNADVFLVWCVVTEGDGVLTTADNGVQSVTPTTVNLGDGTRLDYRTYSGSGGHAIDINVPGVTKLYKVHVSR